MNKSNIVRRQICGFNVFGQLNKVLFEGSCDDSGIVKQFKGAQIFNIRLIEFAWNHLVFVNDEGELFSTLSQEVDEGTLSSLKNLPFAGLSIVQIACTRDKLFCVLKEGELWEYNYETSCWRNLKTLLPLCSDEGSVYKVTKVSVGSTFTAVLLHDGQVAVLPNEVLPVSPILGSVVNMCTGLEHGVLLTSQGAVMTWGTALRGQLGNDTVDVCPVPAEVQALAGLECIAIGAGGWHSCAVSKDGDLYMWGWNKFGQLGRPRHSDDLENGIAVAYVPIVVDWPLDEPPSVKSVYCGTGHTIARLENDELWGCGWNKYGQLGLGAVEFVWKMTKLSFSSVEQTKVTNVVCGAWNSAIFEEDCSTDFSS